MQSGWNRLFGKHVKPQMDLEGAFSIPLLCLQVHLPRLPPVLKQACVGGGKPCTANPSQGQQERGRRRQDLGFRDLSLLRKSLLSSGFHPALAESELRQCILSSTCCVPTLEILGQSWRSPKTAPQVAKKDKKNLHLCPLSSVTGRLSTFLSYKSP